VVMSLRMVATLRPFSTQSITGGVVIDRCWPMSVSYGDHGRLPGDRGSP